MAGRIPSIVRIEQETGRTRQEILADHSRRRLSPETAASELNISLSTYHQLVRSSGGRFATGRWVVFPAGREAASRSNDR